jgi:predicted alpha/beta-hydrolase family hydrolase
MLYLGYPLHPAGKPDALRADHLRRIRIPQFFISGSRDALAQLGALERVVNGLGAGARLHIVPGGDHSLAASRREPLRDSGAWLDAAATFVKTAVAPGAAG